MLPSGTQPKLYNRVGWSRFYLLRAGLLEAVGRARFKISERGLQVIRSNPPEVNVRFLEWFPEFVEFRNRSRQSRPATEGAVEDAEALEKEVPQTESPRNIGGQLSTPAPRSRTGTAGQHGKMLSALL